MGLEIFERVYSSHWFLSSYNGPGFVRDFPGIGGGRFITKAVYNMEDDCCRYIFDNEEFDQTAHFTSDRLINDHRWRARIYKKISLYTRIYFQAGEKIRKMNFALMSDDKIARELSKIIPMQHFHQVYSVLANGVVLDGRNHLSNKIRDELKAAFGNSQNFEEHWALLTLVTKMSLRQKKQYQLALLAAQSKKLGKTKTRLVLQKLHEKYCWLDYNNMGPASTLSVFEEELKDTAKNAANRNTPLHLKKIKAMQKKAMNKYRFNKRQRFLVRLAQYVIWQKGFRKDMQYHGFYCYENLFRAMARRNKTDDWQQFGYLFPWEAGQFLISKTPSLSELQER